MAISVAKGTKLTIGGKAIGKKVAMKKSKDVIYLTAKVLSVLHLVR